MKAWRTEALGVTSVVFAITRGKASYATYLSANDAGWDVTFKDIRCRRAPEYDGLLEASQFRPGTCLGEGFVSSLVPEGDAVA